MARVVIISDINPATCMEIVREIRAMGLVQGKHFDFKYCPAEYDNDSYEAVENRRAEFHFYEDKWGTFFAIKYAS